MAMQIMVDGIQREATPEEEAAFLASLPPVEAPKLPPMERLDFWLSAAELGVTKADAIETAKKAFSDDKRALARIIAFIEEKPRYELEDPILIAMAAAEGITEDQLRALWAWHFPAA